MTYMDKLKLAFLITTTTIIIIMAVYVIATNPYLMY
jgi:hypothetical protein